ncbi:hypothetical protein AAKU67_003974 [Oxalobacteraceae bacterium GrIS 2.11]
MALTSQAPWPSRRLTRDEMRAALVEQVSNRACWRCGKYLGSMLYFDFGGKVEIPSMRQGVISQGEAILGVRDCYWSLLSKNQLVIDSDSISDDNAIENLRCLQGTFLCDFLVPEPGHVNFVFSGGVVLSLDTTNRYATRDNIAEYVAPDGRIYTITPQGHFYLSDEVSKIRFTQ